MFFFLGISIFTMLFLRRHNLIKNHKLILNKTLKKTDPKKVKNLSLNLKKTLFFSGALGADSLFNYLYQLSKIDSNFLDAIKSVHGNSQNLDSSLDVINYVKTDIIHDGLQLHEVHKYKGYVGEKAHFDYLRAEGHEVEVPDTPNQEGYDAIVDGEKVNIKVSDSEDYIQNHLDENLDIPVHTGSELDQIDNVVGFDHLSNTTIESATEAGFEDIDSFGKTGIPFITIGLSGYRNFKKVKNGDKDALTGLEHTATDVVGLIGGLAIGKAVIPIPIVGAVIGGLVGKKIGDLFKGRHFRKADNEFKNLCISMANKFPKRVESISNKAYEINKSRKSKIKKQADQNILIQFFNPNLKTTFIKLATKQNDKEEKQFISKLEDIKQQIESTEDDKLFNLGYKLSQTRESLFLGDSELTKLSKKINRKIQIVEKEKRKAS